MTPKKFVVEHLDNELGPWSELEYLTIANECHLAGDQFCLSSVPTSLVLPPSLTSAPGFSVDHRSVETIHVNDKMQVCLLDPSAPKKLTPEDGDLFNIFLFGGILGDDPPLDRTSELRKKGYHRRNLGSVQMTTDTAVRVTRYVIQKRIKLDEIDYNDQPEIKISENESITLPFRYIRDADGNSIMPDGMLQLIEKDSDKGFEELIQS